MERPTSPCFPFLSPPSVGGSGCIQVRARAAPYPPYPTLPPQTGGTCARGWVASRRGAVLGRRGGGNTCRCFCLSYLSGLEDGLSPFLPSGNCKERRQITYQGVHITLLESGKIDPERFCLFILEGSLYFERGCGKSFLNQMSLVVLRGRWWQKVIVPLYRFRFLGRVSLSIQR